MEGAPYISRPIFLLEMIAALVFFWWFYRNRLSEMPPPDDVKNDRFYQASRVLLIVSLPFFGISALANFFGYMSLAQYLGDGILRALYTALILYAVVRVVDGLIVFALRFRPLTKLKMVRDYTTEIQQKTERLTRIAAIISWIYLTLEYFALRQTVTDYIWNALTAKLNVGSASISVWDVFLFVFVIWAAFKISRLIRFVLQEDVFPRVSLAPGLPYAISTILTYAILLVGTFFAISIAGFDLTRVTVLVSAFGVGIGFGLQNIFNNFISGLILLFERPIKVGDEILVNANGASGTVKRIGIRASRIRMWDNSEVILPNSLLISERVTNWSRSIRRRGIEIPVNVPHGTDTEIVISLLKEIAAKNPRVTESPEPQVLLFDVVTPLLNFRLRVWTKEIDNKNQINTELAEEISRVFAENNIPIVNKLEEAMSQTIIETQK